MLGRFFRPVLQAPARRGAKHTAQRKKLNLTSAFSQATSNGSYAGNRSLWPLAAKNTIPTTPISTDLAAAAPNRRALADDAQLDVHGIA
jgi:hypothetical protein